MKSLFGLFTDCHEHDQPEGTYRHAKNMVDSENLGALENEKGTIEMVMNTTTLPMPIIGSVSLDEGIAVFLADGTDSEIGLVEVDIDANTSTYTAIYNDPALAFDRDFPIQGTYQVNPLGERLVAWIDGLNPPRIVNIDNPNISNINALSLFPTFTSARLNAATVNNTGGSLLAGSYIPFTRYLQTDGTATNYVVYNKSLQITSSLTSLSFAAFKGNAQGQPSSKSISWEFIDVDLSYDRLQIGVLALVNGTLQPRIIAETKISASTLTYTYTGAEVGEDITLSELLTPLIAYQSAKAITQLNNTLFLGNLTADSAPDLQSIANQITINYTVRKVAIRQNTDNPGNHRDMNIQAGFKSGEVYAFYFVVEMEDGAEYAYHIPGRGSQAADLVSRSEGSTSGLNFLHYQVRDTSNSVGAYTNMGYWRNQDENYPADFPTGKSFSGTTEALANTPVRHHKFPYMDKVIVEEGYSLDTSIGVTHALQLGIDVSSVFIPLNLQPLIKRWKIAYAQKNDQNSTIVANDLLQYSSTRTPASIGNNWPATTDVLFNGGNWAIHNFINIFGQDGQNSVFKNSFRGHALDFMYSRPAVVPAYIRCPYRLQVTDLNGTYTGDNTVGTLNYWNRGEQAGGAVCDFTVAGKASRLTVTGGNNYHAIQNFKYLGQNALDAGISTRYSGASLYAEFINPSYAATELGVGTSIIRTNSDPGSSDISLFTGTYKTEQTALVEYCQLLRNVNIGVFEQTLLLTDKNQVSTQSALLNIYGGDTYLCPMTFVTSVAAGSAATDGYSTSRRNCFFFKRFIGESKKNWNLRYEGEDIGKKMFGPTTPQSFWNPALTGTLTDNKESLFDVDVVIINDIQYNTDYDQRPPCKALIITDLDEFATSAPTTIIRSETQSLEKLETSWKTFLPDDRWIMPKNRGEITNLESLGNEDLIIHHKHSFFITKTRVGLGGANSDDVTLKSTDLFEIPPQEILTTEGGYAGTQNPLACKMTKYGYFFIDDSQKKIFLYTKNELQEISGIGMRGFFRDYIGVKKDNVFLDKGYTVGYDLIYNRLLVTKRNSTDDESLTISYGQGNSRPHWVSFHDYIPDFFVETADGNLFSWKNDRLYRHSVGERGSFYGTIYPSLVDVVYNNFNGASVVFGSLDWMALVYDADKVLLDETFDYITARTFDKCSGKILLEPLVNVANFYEENIRSLNQIWHFNTLRDISLNPGFVQGFYDDYNIDNTKLNSNVPWYRKRLFIDKYLLCRYEYANLAGNQLLFLGHDVNITPALRQ